MKNQPDSAFPIPQRDRIFARDGNKCLRCEQTKGLTLDHVVPSSRGGTNKDSNLQTLCSSCNSWKGARIMEFDQPAAWIAEYEFILTNRHNLHTLATAIRENRLAVQSSHRKMDVVLSDDVVRALRQKEVQRRMRGVSASYRNNDSLKLFFFVGAVVPELMRGETYSRKVSVYDKDTGKFFTARFWCFSNRSLNVQPVWLYTRGGVRQSRPLSACPFWTFAGRKQPRKLPIKAVLNFEYFPRG